MTNNASPFDTVASDYDRLFTDTPLGRAKRDLVRQRISPFLKESHTVLELNCGTGEDAIWLAGHVSSVLATDASAAMVSATETKAQAAGCTNIETRQMRIEDLDSLHPDRRFDLVLSNFDGMNCVEDLRDVSSAISRRMLPGATLILVMISSFSLLETVANLLRGRFARAFGRRNRGPVSAPIGNGESMPIYYHRPADVQKAFEEEFELREMRGIGIILPPTSMLGLYNRATALWNLGARLERSVADLPGLNRLADHTLYRFEHRRSS